MKIKQLIESHGVGPIVSALLAHDADATIAAILAEARDEIEERLAGDAESLVAQLMLRSQMSRLVVQSLERLGEYQAALKALLALCERELDLDDNYYPEADDARRVLGIIGG